MLTTIVLISIVLAGFALLWWGVNRLGMIPEPVKTVVLVILGLLALVVIYNYVAGGGMHIHFSR